jgi:hypothetical protein
VDDSFNKPAVYELGKRRFQFILYNILSEWNIMPLDDAP